MTATPRAAEGGDAALGAAHWLCLAAAPTFAMMALLTGVFGGAATGMLCSTMPGASALSGMVPMYLLMSAFHLAPWLKLISRRNVTDDGQKMDQRPCDASAAATTP
jgi:ABC-type Na+ efflux pump permease subunit